MKKFTFNLSFLLLLLTASLVAFSGCKDDDDDLSRADFVGTYNVAEVCDNMNYNYSLSIAEVSDSDDEVTITNLWDWEEVMTATVSGSTLTIASQEADGITFAGSGTLSDNTLVITYTAVDNVDTESCVATATRQ